MIKAWTIASSRLLPGTYPCIPLQALRDCRVRWWSQEPPVATEASLDEAYCATLLPGDLGLGSPGVKLPRRPNSALQGNLRSPPNGITTAAAAVASSFASAGQHLHPSESPARIWPDSRDSPDKQRGRARLAAGPTKSPSRPTSRNALAPKLRAESQVHTVLLMPARTLLCLIQSLFCCTYM